MTSCPECGSTKGYSPVGKYRTQCLGCNALLKNEEVQENSNEEHDETNPERNNEDVCKTDSG